MKNSSTANQPPKAKAGQPAPSGSLVCNGSPTRAMGTTHSVSPVFSSVNGPQVSRSKLLGTGR